MTRCEYHYVWDTDSYELGRRQRLDFKQLHSLFIALGEFFNAVYTARDKGGTVSCTQRVESQDYLSR